MDATAATTLKLHLGTTVVGSRQLSVQESYYGELLTGTRSAVLKTSKHDVQVGSLGFFLFSSLAYLLRDPMLHAADEAHLLHARELRGAIGLVLLDGEYRC